MRPGFDPPAEPARQLTRACGGTPPAARRLTCGKRRAASASGRGPRPHSLSRSVRPTARVARQTLRVLHASVDGKRNRIVSRPCRSEGTGRIYHMASRRTREGVRVSQRLKKRSRSTESLGSVTRRQTSSRVRRAYAPKPLLLPLSPSTTSQTIQRQLPSYWQTLAVRGRDKGPNRHS